MLLANPGYLWLFLLFIPLIAWYVYKQRTLNASMEVSTVASFAKAPRSIRASLRHLLFILQLAAIGCVIIVLARPQTRDSQHFKCRGYGHRACHGYLNQYACPRLQA